jgi:copper chaperone
METIQLKINGMTCGSCVNSVTRVLEAVPGVTKAVVSLEHKHAIVTHDPARAGVEQLKAAVEDAGYDVV